MVLVAALLAACAKAPVQDPQDSVVPGTVGITVRQEGAALVVSGAREGSGARVGDVVLRYNGEAVSSSRQFYRLVIDSAPGSVARLELLREGNVRTLEVPVRELDLMPRA